jgi:hypothetical protein
MHFPWQQSPSLSQPPEFDGMHAHRLPTQFWVQQSVDPSPETSQAAQVGRQHRPTSVPCTVVDCEQEKLSQQS